MVPAGRLLASRVSTVTPGWAIAGEGVAGNVIVTGGVCACSVGTFSPRTTRPTDARQMGFTTLHVQTPGSLKGGQI